MLEAKLKVLKRREMVAEIGKLAAEEEERRTKKKLATALRRMKGKEDFLMEASHEEESRMEERSIDRVDNDGVGGMFDNSPLQSAMTEFFLTSTPGPLDGAATTPAPFTLTDNTLRNSTAPLHFGHRELIAVAEPSSAANINYGSRMERERERIHNLGLDGFSILQIHRGGCFEQNVRARTPFIEPSNYFLPGNVYEANISHSTSLRRSRFISASCGDCLREGARERAHSFVVVRRRCGE